jgi:RNA polymerase sigma-70 factor (ECF subfamily)
MGQGEESVTSARSPADPPTVEALVGQESHKVLAYLQRHLPQELRPTIEPADVLQDTYFEAFRRLSEFRWDGADSVYRWLVTIARNRVIDLVRMKRALKRGGERARRQVLTDAAFGQDSIVLMLTELAVYQRTPSRSAVRREIIAALERSVDGLPVTQRDVIRLRYLEGLPIEEIAKRMGRTPGAIKQLCNRAYKALRVEMRSASMYL